MRRYYVRFRDRVDAFEPLEAAKRRLVCERHWHMADYWFGGTLGELRSGACMQVEIIAFPSLIPISSGPRVRDTYAAKETMPRDFEQHGEVGNDVVAGAVHPAKFFLLLDGRLRLSDLGPSAVSNERTVFWAAS